MASWLGQQVKIGKNRLLATTIYFNFGKNRLLATTINFNFVKNRLLATMIQRKAVRFSTQQLIF